MHKEWIMSKPMQYHAQQKHISNLTQNTAIMNISTLPENISLFLQKVRHDVNHHIASTGLTSCVQSFLSFGNLLKVPHL